MLALLLILIKLSESLNYDDECRIGVVDVRCLQVDVDVDVQCETLKPRDVNEDDALMRTICLH